MIQSKKCFDCGSDISHKGNRAKRCDLCLGPYYLKRMEKKKVSQMLNRGGYQYTLPSQDISQVFNSEGYPYQSSNDNYFKIYREDITQRIRKICRVCNREEKEIKGKWAPIYSELNSNGDEVDYILLCLDCYEKRCDEAS